MTDQVESAEQFKRHDIAEAMAKANARKAKLSTPSRTEVGSDEETDSEELSDEPHAAVDENDRAADLPEIWPSVEMAKTVTETVDALRADPEIFVRGGALTRVIPSDGTDPTITRELGAPVLRRAVAPWITERASMFACFMATKTKGRGANKVEVDVRTPPPGWISAHVLARGTWPGYRGLTGVVTSPTMRRDGSVLQDPGYDQASGLLYLPRESYRRVPAVPKREAANAACARLLEVVDDFPLSDLGKAGWLALLLTMLARELVDGSTPLFAIDAHSAGSGKGLLARVAHLIVFGTDIAHMSLPPDEEEMRKQITTTLLCGDPAVLLDNVSVPIGGDSIEALITAPVWKARLLGKMEDTGSLPVRLVTVASGNGLEFSGDMGRRSLRIRLDSPHESPEERDDYKHPERAGAGLLLAWTREHRAELVIDALTILRAWHVAGRLGEVGAWGSFESWAATIARCVQWIGLPDPTLGRATAAAGVDPQKQALSVVYDAIRRLGGEGGITAGGLCKVAFPPPRDPPNGEDDLAEAIGALTPSSRGDAPTRARLLGRKLKAGKIIRLEVGGTSNDYALVATPGGARSVRYSVSAKAVGSA